MTSVTARPVGLKVKLAIMSVSTFIADAILYSMCREKNETDYFGRG